MRSFTNGARVQKPRVQLDSRGSSSSLSLSVSSFPRVPSEFHCFRREATRHGRARSFEFVIVRRARFQPTKRKSKDRVAAHRSPRSALARGEMAREAFSLRPIFFREVDLRSRPRSRSVVSRRLNATFTKVERRKEKSRRFPRAFLARRRSVKASQRTSGAATIGRIRR